MSSHEKVAVVTGAGSGIGQATALAFLKDGWRVALVGGRKETLDETLKVAGADATRALAVPTDVADPAALQRLFDQVKQTFGRVDAVFNNAGQNAPGIAFEDLPFERWKSVVDTNLTGSFCALRRRFA